VTTPRASSPPRPISRMQTPLRAAGLSLLPALLCGTARLSAQEKALLPPPESELLLLGTFHFSNPGLDSYKPEHTVDIFAAERQKQLDRVLDQLEAWDPTRIAVEVKAADQSRLDASYSAYLAGDKELTSNEVHQIGFRLGRRLGLDSLVAVDAPGRSYEPRPDATSWAMSNGQAAQLFKGGWEAKYKALYTRDDAAKMERTLIEHLLYLNDEERLRVGHGHYLVGAMGVGDGVEYPGADARTAWYNRNRRIFSNLLRTAEKDDRILVLIGAGHVPILRHAVDASPDLELVTVDEVLSHVAP